MGLASLSHHGARMTAFERQVAGRIRTARALQGMSQPELGNRIGVSYQQIYKHETGRIVITIGRLHQIAEALGVPLSYFLADQPNEELDLLPAKTSEGQNVLLQAYRQLALKNRSLLILIATSLAETEYGPKSRPQEGR
jgi:transcriptional regulator with XRE-family HTH domain